MLIRRADATMTGHKLVMILMMIHLLSVAECDTLTSLTILYKDLEQAPAASYKLEDITVDGLSPNICLLRCSKHDSCRAVVLDGTTCSLYNTTTTAVPLPTGQTAIGETSRQAKYD